MNSVAGTELFGEAFHWGCWDPSTGAVEADNVPVADEFGCGARTCPAAYSECNVSRQCWEGANTSVNVNALERGSSGRRRS